MSARRPATLRREIVWWYSLVLVLSLGILATLTFFLLRGALERSARTSMAQSAQAVERLYFPPSIPRISTRHEIFRMPEEGVELIRRTSVLITGDTAITWFSRSDETESDALYFFLLISGLLIPVTAAGAALGGRVLLDRLLQPLERLVASTREIGITGLSRRVEVPERPAELHDLARAYNEMLVRLERAVQGLTDFTADASHELRTPLTSIRGSIQVALARERSKGELEEVLTDVLGETEWMLHLVEGLLTLSRGDAADPEMEGVEVDVSQLLHDVHEVGQALAVGKMVTFRLDVPNPLLTRGSPAGLRQVLLNLVSNAVKFTESGSISLGGRVVARPAADSGTAGEWIEVTVSDTGVGISEGERARIFDRFYRGEAARGRPAGTGLGLAIARLIVERHGGSIEVESEPGLGSTFRVLLPALAVPAALAATPSDPGEM